MSVTVGLDFGTHQTKVCIEDAKNPLLKRYTFFPFKDPAGRSSFVLPSIVQINKDDTLSYGFVDELVANFLQFEGEVPEPFVFPEYVPAIPPTRPVMRSYPERPLVAKRSFNLRDLASLLGRDRQEVEYRLRCNQIDQENKVLIQDHDLKLDSYQKAEEERRSIWELEYAGVFEAHQHILHQIESKRNKVLHFRYFKSAALGDNRYWDFDPADYNPRLISVLYLAFVLYSVEKDYSADVFVQMGVPQTLGSLEGGQISESGCRLLILARKLTMDWSLEEFLTLKYSELKQLVNFDQPVDEIIKNELGVKILPEAYAGLVALTARRRIPNGFSLLIDIGGGTTDIALFTLANEQRAPDIAKVVSVKGGLNSIIQVISEELGQPMARVQSNFPSLIRTSSGERAREVLNESLRDSISSIVGELFVQFMSLHREHGLTRDHLAQALNSRPIFYCGGGGVYPELRESMTYFTDVKQVSLGEMGIQNLTSIVSAPFDTILAVSYGLSMLSDENVICTPPHKLFSHLIRSSDETNYSRDYSD
jgi:hypothetical protein